MRRLLDTFNVLEENQLISDQISSSIKDGLKFIPRQYQISAINRFEYFLKNYKKRPYPSHLFFHMATGSGKTLVMAANIIQLYENGYRNFIFVTHLTNIIKKTKDNFLNNSSENSKYLFSSPLNIQGKEIFINEINNIPDNNNNFILNRFQVSVNPINS